MAEIPGIHPSSSSSQPNPEHGHGAVDPQKFSKAMADAKVEKESSKGGGSPPASFATTAWGFDAAEAKKFVSTLANTIIAQIKHEDQQIKEQNEKLKEAEQGEDQ